MIQCSFSLRFSMLCIFFGRGCAKINPRENYHNSRCAKIFKFRAARVRENKYARKFVRIRYNILKKVRRVRCYFNILIFSVLQEWIRFDLWVDLFESFQFIHWNITTRYLRSFFTVKSSPSFQEKYHDWYENVTNIFILVFKGGQVLISCLKSFNNQ